MTLRIHAPNPIRVGETANVLVTSDNPGVVSLVYGAGLTGPATVTIEGTRVWTIGNRGGQYLACPSIAQTRNGCTWLFSVDLGKLNHGTQLAMIPNTMIAQSLRDDAVDRINWGIGIQSYRSSATAQRAVAVFFRSAANAAASVAANGSVLAYTATSVIRYAVVYNAGRCKIYTANRATVADSAFVDATGTMGGSEVLVLQSGSQVAKFTSVLSDSALDAWFASGTVPAGSEFAYLGGHEIDPSIQKIYDSSENNYDLYNHQFAAWPPPSASGDYTDDPLNPVVPYALVPVTAVATTGCTIDATRPRQGVPARASEAEKTETATQVTVTVKAPLVSIGPDVTGTAARFPALRRLTVFSETDGAVTLASDNAKVLVPASVTVVDGFATFDVSISGAVSGVTLTATQDGETATCDVDLSFGVHAVPEMAPNDTLQLFPEWLWTEPHTQGIAAVMDDRRAAFVSDLDHLLIYDFANQTSAMLDLVAEMFAIYGWNKAAGTTEKVAFLESSLKILRKSGTHYAVKEAIRLVCDAAKIESITVIPGAGNLFNGYYDFDGSINYDSLYHWAKFDVEIYTSDIPYFSDEIKTVITSMINHYKPASRWFENLLIKGIA